MMYMLMIIFIKVVFTTALTLEEKFEFMERKQEVMEGRIRELEKRVQYCEASKLTAKRLLDGNSVESSMKIAFDAKLSGTLDHTPNADTTIVFDDVLTNSGDAYKKDIGVFIAPVNGVYLFSYTIHSAYSTSIIASLTVDGHKVTAIHADGASDGKFVATSSRTSIIALRQSDRVYIQIGKNSRGVVLSGNGGGHSSFTGALLFTN